MNLEESYKKLEVDPTTSTEDIKKAYRKLAKTYHPDINPDGKENFTLINEAYNMIINCRDKGIYTQSRTSTYSKSTNNSRSYYKRTTNKRSYNTSYNSNHGYDPSTGQTLWEEIYANNKRSNNFHSGFNFQYQAKGPNKNIDYELTKEDIKRGRNSQYITKQIYYFKRTICPACSGTGKESTTCSSCGGSGIDRSPTNNIIVNCKKCGGQGVVDSPTICAKCASRGFINVNSYVRVRVPTNISEDFYITLPGKGDEVQLNPLDKGFFISGDLVIRIIPYSDINSKKEDQNKVNGNKKSKKKGSKEDLGTIRISMLDLIKGKVHVFDRDEGPSIRINIKPKSQLGEKEIKDTEGNIYKFRLELRDINYNTLNDNHIDMISYLSKNNII